MGDHLIARRREVTYVIGLLSLGPIRGLFKWDQTVIGKLKKMTRGCKFNDSGLFPDSGGEVEVPRGGHPCHRGHAGGLRTRPGNSFYIGMEAYGLQRIGI
jgi:hypothetical protein